MNTQKASKRKTLLAILLGLTFALTMVVGLFATNQMAYAATSAPTKDDTNLRIFANGTAVVVKEDAGLTKIYAATNLSNALFSGIDIGNYVIYGGWETGNETGNTSVTIDSGTLLKTVYGGSRQGTITGNTSVTVNGGKLTYLYGGGWEGSVTGDTSVTVNGGNVFDGIYNDETDSWDVFDGGIWGGGNQQSSTVTGTAYISVNDDCNIHMICGGGWKGSVGGTDINVIAGTISQIYGGGSMDESAVNGDVSITAKGTAHVGGVYGGAGGVSITGSAFIVIDGNAEVGYVFGVTINADLSGSVNITVKGGTIGDSVNPFAIGGTGGNSVDKINITIQGGEINGDVYGVWSSSGSEAGDVVIIVESGEINGDVYGVLSSTGSETIDVSLIIFPGTVITGDAYITSDGGDAGAGSDIVKLTQAEVAQMVAQAKAALTWDVIKGTNTAQNNVTANLTLPASGANGTTISWSSDSMSVVSADGTVTRQNADINITLVATITKGAEIDTVVFNLTVKKAEQAGNSDADAVAADKAALTWAVIKNTNTAENNVTANLNLITSGTNGSTISWSSDSMSVVSANGTVTRQNADINITLVATITKGAVTDTVTFNLTIKQLSQTNPTTYTVTVTGGTANPTSGAAGTSVNLTVGTAPKGKQFKEWKVVSGGVTVTNNTFIIGTENVVIEAVWANKGLSGGAIAGIVIGVIAVLGAAGFCVYWFIIRKKKAVK